MIDVPSVVNFSQFKLEKHVERALNFAWTLSKGQPVEAGQVLESAIFVNRRSQSKAFSKLASLFPGIKIEEPESEPTNPVNLAAMRLAGDLSHAFSVAEGFFKDVNSVWGRDLVTFVLLAKDSSSLEVLAAEAGVSIETVRSDWMDYVRSSDQHRPRGEWDAWVRAAGIHSSEDQNDPVKAYLVLWNPSRYTFSDVEGKINEIGSSGSSSFSWRTGSRKKMEVGARLFLFRTGVEPRGLVGVGTVQSEVREEPHRDPEKRKKGRTSPYVEASWEALAREPFLGLEAVVSKTDERQIWSSRGGGVEIPTDVAARLEDAWHTAWERHKRGLSKDHLPDLPRRQLIAGFDADTGDRVDTLNVERYVDAFARVMASKALVPPLSVGLFGDWGSGKTFFMDKLYESIEELSGDRSAESNQLYWQNICQIRFNAWHYAETKLWASLVTTIFNELRKFLEGSGDNTEEGDEFNKLLNKLEVVSALREEALTRLEKAKEAHRIAQKALLAARKTLEDQPAAPEPSSDEIRKILSSAISKVAIENGDDLFALVTSAAKMSGRDDLKKTAENFCETGRATVKEAREVLQQTSTMALRAGFWWRILLAAKIHRYPGFWVAASAVISIPILFGLLEKHGELNTSWAVLSTTILEILAIGTGLIAWLKSRLALATPVFDKLDELRLDIEQRIKEAKSEDQLKYEQDCKHVQAAEEEARKVFEKAQQEVLRAAQTEQEAKQALRESTSKARLDKFIRERAASEDYEVHLGLIAMIHRDFQRLSDLMEKVRKDKDIAEAEDIPRVDRIILYIDDLDRCHPPERVVRVLEAIHLLLFFPLFVVVVGVDSRWVSRALDKHYEGMLADETLHNGTIGIGGARLSEAGSDSSHAISVRALQRPPAESQDFLEKIFQVPFWLRRMDRDAVRRMVRKLIQDDELELPQETPSALDPDTEPVEIEDLDEDNVEPKDDERADSSSEMPDRQRASITRTTKQAELQEDLASAAASLTISPAERQFMEDVAPLMPRTPRSVKRFINIYRLYKSALSNEGLRQFLGTADNPGNFRAVQVLLALVTGTPHCARRVFDQLHNADGERPKRLSDLVTDLEVGPASWQTTIDALREFAQGDNDLKLNALWDVSELVSRYSVHHMVTDAPGENSMG